MSTEIEHESGADSREGAGGAAIDIQRERLHVLLMLDRAERLASFERVRSPAVIKLRTESARALTYIAATRAAVIKDFSLSELEARLKQLEEAVKKENED